MPCRGYLWSRPGGLGWRPRQQDRRPVAQEANRLRTGSYLAAQLSPAQSPELLEVPAEQGVTPSGPPSRWRSIFTGQHTATGPNHEVYLSALNDRVV